MNHLSIAENDVITESSEIFAKGGSQPNSLYHPLALQDVLEALPEAVYTTDAVGRITFYNKAAAVMWGVSPELGASEFFGSWKLYRPDGTPLPHDECPMAIALKERRAVRGLEAVAERPDGTRVAFLALPTPIFDAAGNLSGAVNMLVDLTELTVAEEAAQRFAAIVESSDDAILAKDLNGTIVNWNRGAERLFGYTAEEAIGQPVLMLIPLDRQNEEPEILARIRRGERIDHYETIRRRKDGRLVEISLSVSPIKNREGRVVGASKIARDITERRRAEEQQHLLIREMDHRVKNLFSLASSVVSLSARAATTPGELASAVSARLNALALAHALTVPRTSDAASRNEQTTMLHALIQTIVAPYDVSTDNRRSRAIITGPDVTISGSAVTSFALLLHEFATNAAKYGALSTSDGRVDITCVEDGEHFMLTWTEIGGPRVERQSDGDGFGSILAKATVRSQLGGEISREWRPEGLSIRLTVRADRLVA
ncbi:MULTISPECIES: PAS domain S-box protein [Rhizobium]|uniref:Blue-light-activated histidine kinase n=1 Tax=Rhizobium lusitanum TaxID=293958 RepID=A0A1C3W055_9HYPH|nr:MULTISPECIES: PAS domain S-box protein [Rhizobium]NKJ34892.1 PAS domain S-box-containing protein [Rhizobium sp. SG570]SCB33328.1 PAS domain S-box-containing protein [Rhizobium lusitanum]